ncbi:hypothetical protein [Clostridium estertheticum]|nr:hypothetical protein [Clostridium estertheticum]MBU3173316.1 hypothetical protein [Clostridium estertheticum]
MKVKIWYLYNQVEMDKTGVDIIDECDLDNFEKQNNATIIKSEDVY